jgi:hypothetical protein
MITFFRGIKEIKNFRKDYEDFKNKITTALEVHGIHLESAELSKAEKIAANAFGMSYERYQKVKQKPQIDPTLARVIDLEFGVYELKETIKTLQTTLDKEQVPAQLVLPVERTKTTKKPKLVKLQAVEEEVKKVKSKLTQAKVKRLFEYRDGELYWKVDRVRAKKGDKAGANKRYKHILIEGQYYTCGRIIFLMFHGYLPEYVSYIDGNSLNTRIENLRAATASQIRCNAKRGINNTSGFKGVGFNKQVGKYKAAIVKKKKFYHLGYFDTPKEAHKAYRKAAKKLHGEFARVA